MQVTKDCPLPFSIDEADYLKTQLLLTGRVEKPFVDTIQQLQTWLKVKTNEINNVSSEFGFCDIVMLMLRGVAVIALHYIIFKFYDIQLWFASINHFNEQMGEI